MSCFANSIGPSHDDVLDVVIGQHAHEGLEDSGM